jgi:TRAP-type mannitol/chloroaromatic compound transport system permease small subunit
LEKLLTTCERALGVLCLLVASTTLPLLIGLRIWEIYSRNVLDRSSQLFDFAESEALVLLVFLSLAYAYTRDIHVRVDVLRARWSERTRAIIELFGAIMLVAPFVCVVVYYGIERVEGIAALGQRSALALGKPWGWVVHAAMPLGIGLFGFAVALGAIRNVRFLMGMTAQRTAAPVGAGPQVPSATPSAPGAAS